MVTAAKTVSQVGAHMVIAFTIMYWMTGSVAFGGLAALIEPVCNVALLPVHDRLWRILRQRVAALRNQIRGLAAQKLSQVLMHMAVAFAVMYWATGSLAFGGLAAILEPICNVAFLPLHDGVWERIRRRVEPGKPARWVAV